MAKAQGVTVSVYAVEQTAVSWFAIIDAEDYALSWEQLGVLAKASVTESQWADAIAQSKRLFGDVNARELRAIDTSTAMLGLPTGEYATLTFSSTIEKDQTLLRS